MVATWTNPALFAALAALVFSGDVAAPLVALAAVLAPSLAMLQAPGETRTSGGAVVAGVRAVSVMVILWSGFLLLGDVAGVLHLARGPLIAVVAAAAAVVAGARPLRARASLLVPLGIACVVVCASGLAVSVGAPPWRAWAELASRPALAFPDAGAWVTQGRSVTRPTRLTFTEPHRVTATSAGIFRVTEHDGASVAVREWRLAAGDSLHLRSGDELVLSAGASVRFEAGKRIPGVPPSGVAWAAPRARQDPRRLAEVLAIALTLSGGALALLGPCAGMRASLQASALLLAFVLAAVSWGIYAALRAPELALGADILVAVVEAPLVVAGPAWRAVLPALSLLGMAALCVAAAPALRERLIEVACPAGPDELATARRAGAELLWLGVLVIAAALSWWPADAWRVLLAGLGFAASAWAAPGLVAGAGAGSAALAGGGAFLALTLAGSLLPPAMSLLGAYPVVIAVPVAAAVALASRAPVARRRRG